MIFSLADIQEVVKEELLEEYAEVLLFGESTHKSYVHKETRNYCSINADNFGFRYRLTVTTIRHCGFNFSTGKDCEAIQLTIISGNLESSIIIFDSSDSNTPTLEQVGALRERIIRILDSD